MWRERWSNGQWSLMGKWILGWKEQRGLARFLYMMHLRDISSEEQMMDAGGNGKEVEAYGSR